MRKLLLNLPIVTILGLGLGTAHANPYYPPWPADVDASNTSFCEAYTGQSAPSGEFYYCMLEEWGAFISDAEYYAGQLAVLCGQGDQQACDAVEVWAYMIPWYYEYYQYYG